MSEQPVAGPAQTPLGYVITCPTCGGQLAPHVGLPQTAPWLCANCRRGWWLAELAPEARKRFRPQVFDFGHDGTVAAAVATELEAAIKRGNSVHPSMANLPGVAAALAALQGKA